MRLLPLLYFLAAFSNAAESRLWTDQQDRKIAATLVGVEDQNVTLRLKDGRKIPYPLAKLSPNDCQYVENYRAQLALENASEPASILNFDGPWPERVKFGEDPKILTVEENSDTKRYVYESANYRYVCDVRLTQSVVKGFAVLFEATQHYCRSLPLAINGGIKVAGKLQILLFEQFDNYVKAGGPPNSAGVFISGQGVVIVPLASLGVKPVGSSYMLDRAKNNNTLPHELTHQLTPETYFKKGSLGWLSEGIAEYVATTPYRSGTFNVRGNQKEIFDFTTGYGTKDRGGRALGTKIHLPDLKSFMLQDYSGFLGQSTQLNYGGSLLITNYFFHMDGEGDAKRIKSYLKALHDGQDAEQSLALLLDGRSFEKLQEDIAKAWHRKGIDLTFAMP
ncbi:MAG: SHD1 domain-containing protein [Verrucomicrobiota bacterium]